MAVYELYGVQHLNGLRYRRGGHSYSDSDWSALLDFAEHSFFGRAPAGKRFWERPAPVPPLPGSGGEPGFVRVGDPGNKGDHAFPRVGSLGAVDHSFETGRYKVSNAEYAKFLTAIAAKADPHRLFHPEMKIRRGGREGQYSYDAHPATASAAVTFVSWHDALRYCNWLHGGDTEKGAYRFSGTTLVGARAADARVFLPTENEWYKAAYYDPETKKYNLFPTHVGGRLNLSIGRRPPPKSRYGMLGIDDATWEWTESNVGESFRGLRSESWFQGNNRQAAGRFYINPQFELAHVGFRVARAVQKDPSRPR